MAHIGEARIKIIPQLEAMELLGGSTLDEIATVARKHKVMVSVTVTPYDEDDNTRLESL